jgi:hypothetical protein
VRRVNPPHDGREAMLKAHSVIDAGVCGFHTTIVATPR